MYGLKFNLRSLSTGINKEVYYCGMDDTVAIHSKDKRKAKLYNTFDIAKKASNGLKKHLGYDYGHYIGRIELL